MKKNRVVMLVAMISSLLFTSFIGGPLSYALLYTILLLPVTSFLYLLYVYSRFKVYQTIGGATMLKGEEIHYKYLLSNEDFIYYKGFTVNFLTDYSNLQVNHFQKDISLFPGEKHERAGKLTCLYRGEYKVGIESVVIKDLLGLFSLKMDRPSTLTARVYPQIPKCPSLSALDFEENSKNVPFSSSPRNELLDHEMSKYTPGDELKRVNWKVSAKQHELYVRNYTENPKEKILVFLDSSSITEEVGDAIILEDALLETTLAILNYYTRKNIPAELIYYTDQLHHFQIQSLADFNNFYNATAIMPFSGKHSLGELISSYGAKLSTSQKTIVITGMIDHPLMESLSMTTESNTCLVLVGEKEKKQLQQIKNQLGKTHLLHIPSSGDILEVLSGG